MKIKSLLKKIIVICPVFAMLLCALLFSNVVTKADESGTDDTPTEQKINIIQQQNGTITSDKVTALPGDTIKITATPASGYHLKYVNVTYTDDNNEIKTITLKRKRGETLFNRNDIFDRFLPVDSNMPSNTVKFNMPSTAVTVTPVFSNSLTYEDGLDFCTFAGKKWNINVTIPEGISSFSIYSGYETHDFNQTIRLIAPEGCYLKITGDIRKQAETSTKPANKDFKIYNGADTNAGILISLNHIGSFDKETSGNNAFITYNVSNNGTEGVYYSFIVTVVPLDNSNITISDIPDETYDRQPHTPEVSVYENGNLWIAGEDYDVKYLNNINAGEGVVKIIGKGTHSGVVARKTFNIKPKKVTLEYDKLVAVMYVNVDDLEQNLPYITIIGLIEPDICDVIIADGVLLSRGDNNIPVSLDNSNYEIDGSNIISYKLVERFSLELIIGSEPNPAKNLIYTGNPMDLITPGSISSNDGNVQCYLLYRLTGNNEYSTNVPKGTEPGKYFVEYVTYSTNNLLYGINGTIEVDIKCRILYNAGEGSGTMDLDGKEKNGTYTLPTCTFTAPSGKAFKNWSVKVGNNAAITKNPGDEITITDNTTVTAVWEKIANILVYKFDENGQDIPGDIQGTGDYLIGSEQTFTAPAVDGYNFDGWYSYSENGTHRTGNRLCEKNDYTFTVPNDDTSYVAVYKALGNANITINCDSSFTVNGTTYTSKYQAENGLGKKIELVADGDKFAYWENKYGMVLSRSKKYTFTVTGNETITAVFDNVVDNKATVIFESEYGQVLSRKQLASGDGSTVILPGLPTLNGYTALGWDLNGDGSYDSSSDTIEAAISRGLSETGKTITIRPVYKLKTITYTVNVTGGTGSGTYNQNDVVTVTANAPESGKKFSHWKNDADNKILSYSSSYNFYAEKDIDLTAVFIDNTSNVEVKGTTEMVNMYMEDDQNGKKNLIFVSMSTVPQGCTIKKAGVILTDKQSIGTDENQFNDVNADYVLGDEWSGDAYRYTLTVSDVSSGEIWYARAYLVYTDASGNTHTVYGDIVSQSY
ncbi:MAG: InlB B-repeat-containing protein [Lachnospiraceae bacterium]|nr:InlB B-repeat-containing protein [Lachnospiraceae bacterium]